jgi:UDP-glucose 4-epimerase
MRVLVTGGAGYIGSHTTLALIEKGHVPVVVDDLSNSRREAIARVERMTNTEVEFHEFDVCDTERLTAVIQRAPIDAVMHFAGFKAVGESVTEPLKYFRNNVASMVSVLEAMDVARQGQNASLIFSSSATVYGNREELPIHESALTGVGLTNPYGQTKYFCEEILKSTTRSNPGFQAVALRYFNPIGAHPSGEIGEDPEGIPNNLAPFIAQVASGRLDKLTVFGDDYPTPDGTCVRDYIHVMDVAAGHVAALSYQPRGFHAFNLGTGVGTSVRELVAAYESTTGKEIPSSVGPRRDGDIAVSFADVTLAKEQLHWSADRSIAEACKDSWNWQKRNPQGYRES